MEVRIDPAGVNVRYALIMAEETMTFDGYTFLTPADIEKIKSKPRESFLSWYAEAKGERIAKSFFCTLNGRDLKFRLLKVEVSEVDHNKRFDFRYRADWPLPFNAPTYRLQSGSFTSTWSLHSGFAYEFQFTDDTKYVGKDGKSVTEDAEGVVTLTIDAVKTESFLDADWQQPDRFRGKNRAELKPGEEPLRRTCSATFRMNAIRPPEPEAKSVEPDENRVTIRPDERGVAEKLHESGLKSLLTTEMGLGVLFLLSALFGAAHAFTPGHGKTMVAAYLVGERGSAWHAVVLGLTATAAHTGSVILVAFGLFAVYGNTPPASAQGWLSILGGAFIFFVGLWLFLQRLRGKADHVHLFGSDHHHGPGGHSHEHQPIPKTKSNFGWLRVILLGLGGGIIPCWDAVMMLMVAMAQGQIGLAIPLLFAFSAGLALVMIALGLAVVGANKYGNLKFGESRWFRWLPVLSALILLIVGFWFIRDGLGYLGQVGK